MVFYCSPFFFLNRLYFFHLLVVEFCVSGPRLTRVDVIVMNKDYVGQYLHSVEIKKVAENFWR